MPLATIASNNKSGKLVLSTTGLVNNKVESVGDNRDANVAYCCFPDGCDHRTNPISLEDPGNAVRVICSNDACQEGCWMHGYCFGRWEEQVLNFLASCGRARSWSDKQRQQNIWTKKGYDLAYKACDCKCGRGHLRKDVDYVHPPPKTEAIDARKKKLRRKSESCAAKQGAVIAPKCPQTASAVLSASVAINWNSHGGKPPLRIRTSSLSSTGSNGSPPSSADTPPSVGWQVGKAGTPGLGAKFDFFADAEQAALGCIFKRRYDFSVFSTLPRCQQNPYHIKMEDEGPHGNDETRCFVLTNLSSHKTTEVQCVLCRQVLQVYDKYPLVDGTFFVSPLCYNSKIQVQFEGKSMHLNAVCMHCLYSTFCELHCKFCRTPWSGRFLLIGTMYSYDIFAAVPCCSYRARCKNCQKPVIEGGAVLPFFSDYSKRLQCPHCKADDCHFVKPLEENFMVRAAR